MALVTTLYEKIDDGQIVKITMNRPEKLNAMDHALKEELFEAFQMAEYDENVRVIILAGAGRSFSAGHDMTGKGRPSEHPMMTTKLTGLEGQLRREQHIYVDINLFIRNVTKPTIAQVQGHCIAGGLMVACMCDLIVAADDASFQNPVPRMTPAGAELLVEPWELGVRKAKEFLFLGDAIKAQEACQIGMVNRVVPRESLEAEVLVWARRMAQYPPVTLSLLKRSLNRTLDLMGQANAFDYHLLIHEISHHADASKEFRKKQAETIAGSGLKAFLSERDGSAKTE
ncbi:MAG: enoyl-CoA hydratase [Dehalococcoidia bacterium]|nr:enoyl-CoA hydratase [Dehalococcoidia bacterium]